MSELYKRTLFTIIEPVIVQDREVLQKEVTKLKQSGGETWAIGEMLQRVLGLMALTDFVFYHPDSGNSRSMDEA